MAKGTLSDTWTLKIPTQKWVVALHVVFFFLFKQIGSLGGSRYVLWILFNLIEVW